MRPFEPLRLSRSRQFLAATAAMVLNLLAACRQPEERPRVVILVSIDTLRADHLPCYGYRGVATPAIDALRRDSVLYENAFSHVPLTLPSHATLLTGLLPFQNGVRDNVGFRLARGRTGLAEFLKARGFATGAAVSSYVLRKDRGLAAGFDFYDDRVAGPRRERAGPATVQALEEWVQGKQNGPLFLFLHLNEPHAPYDPPEPFRSQYARSPYDGEIAATDAALGKFVDFLQAAHIYDGAALFLVADHGEGLGEHGEDEHGVFLYQEDIHVPLLMKLPRGFGRGTSVANAAALIDVFPTIADLLGLPLPQGLEGVSLRRLMLPGAPERDIYSETLYPRFAMGWSDLAALENRENQYIEAPRPEFYDRRSDPQERRNLAPSLPPEFRRLRAKLGSRSRPIQSPEAAGAEEARTLASLGYLSGSTASGPPQTLPDPKDHIGVLSEFRRLFELHADGRFAEAIPAARKIVGEDPLCFSAWEIWSDSLVQTGRIAEACRVLGDGIRKGSGRISGEQLTQAYDNLAILLGKSGSAVERLAVLEQALAQRQASPAMVEDLARIYVTDGRDAEAAALLQREGARGPRALNTLGIALARMGKREEARRTFEQTLAEDAQNSEAAFNLGVLFLEEDNAREAADWLRRACQWDPANAAARTSLGLAEIQIGRSGQAESAWSEALEIDPRQFDAMFNMGMLLLREGKIEKARGWLRRFVDGAPVRRYGRQIDDARMALKRLSGEQP